MYLSAAGRKPSKSLILKDVTSKSFKHKDLVGISR